MWYWISLIVAAGGLLALYHYNPVTTFRDWEGLLTRRGRRSVEVLAEQAEIDAAMLDDAYHAAALARLDSDTAEAVYLLELAMSVVEQAVPDRLKRLRIMGLCCRMVSAMLPLGRVGPRDFRLRRLATMAGAADVVAQFLFTAAARFRLRVAFLAWAFQAVLPAMSRSTRRIRRHRKSSAAWGRFAGAVADFKRLDREHVDAFRTLLCSVVETESVIVTQ